MAYAAMRKRLDRLARQAGLTHAQWSALGVLHHFPGSTNSDLESILMVERPSVTSLIKGMVKRGWVVHRADPDDGRVKRFFLTESGAAMAEKTRSLASRVDREVLGALGEFEVVELRRLLKKVIRSARGEHEAPKVDGEGSDQPIGYWLKKADELLTRRINEAQSKNGLNRTEWQTLNVLRRNPRSSRSRIGEALAPFADGEAIGAVLERLVDRGLIASEGEDGPFQLTEQGERAHRQALEEQMALRRRAVDGIGAEEYATALRTLQRLVANLERDGGPAAVRE